MRRIVSSYLEFARGKKKLSLWLILSPFELITRLVSWFRNFFYDHGILPSYEPPIPVISIGNLTLGGTNKTPFVEMIIKELARMGLKPGIITRGYGGTTSEPVVIRNGIAHRDLVGDEPLLLSSRLPGVPLAVSGDRMGDVEALRKEDVDIVVADDAFQHRRLGRDMDIVLVDATSPFGNFLFPPTGILREAPGALSRAHMVVITKSDQVPPEELQKILGRIRKYFRHEGIFFSSLEVDKWSCWLEGWEPVDPSGVLDRKWVVFSAIGNPESFRTFLEKRRVQVVKYHFYKDHHRFTRQEIDRMLRDVMKYGAEGLLCTEKDIHNLPEDMTGLPHILVPRIRAEVDDRKRFFSILGKHMKPEVIVTSNGYGEDTIGAIMAQKLRQLYPGLNVRALPVVGAGWDYTQRGIEVLENTFISPTGGVVKYSFRDLWKDIRAGLLGHIFQQLKALGNLRGKVRTVICVGDVYLLLQTLWGQGQTPILLATAKTVYLRGHWKLEKMILKYRCRRVWTRDQETSREILAMGGNAFYGGNPIMDLLRDNNEGEDPWESEHGLARILILPGSRTRAYRDMSLVLDTAVLVRGSIPSEFVAVLAPSIDMERLIKENEGWSLEGNFIEKEGFRIRLYDQGLVQAARGADIVLGLGGTANQLCAGLGKPVVSILEKGKQVQKKLLGEAESLVPGKPTLLCAEILRILRSEEEYGRMSRAGMSRLGSPGAIDSVISFLAEEMGWELRSRVHARLRQEIAN